MAVQTQLYIPIQGIDYAIIPEISSRGENLFETQLYAQDHDLVFLPSRGVNAVARAVQSETPSRDFTRYVRDRTGLTDSDVSDAYRQLHDGIWSQYFIRASEILVWTRNQQSFDHPRVSLKNTPVESHLITGYRIQKQGDDYRIIDANTSPVNWSRQDGKITKEMAQLLGAQDNTYVWTNPDVQVGEGLRALFWDFWGRVRPNLYSYGGPWDGDSNWGSLLGRRLEPKQ